MKRNQIMLGVLALVVALGVWAAGRDSGSTNKPDFSGRWELDRTHSSFGKMKKPAHMTLEAMRHGDELHAIQTVYDPAGGPDAVEGDWFLDGKEHPLGSDGRMTSMSKWEGDTLVAERRSNDNRFDEKIRFSLSGDGKTAIESVLVEDPSGSDRRKLVWQKRS